ncbi:EAL domain-containing protein [Vibrio sp. CAU 1672]|uniref:EAL domain-containing protein n=1 Tax=Vibrio sp. CAU 1672 TaxID=3032594 RepID=UPI0023DB415E|nr:EAL domain-containing protein [Vibrio sp. CAU 1672]MDF2154522.1 EAL domain-containing protein [Vibrio sp. CAU 1672]
MLHNHVDIFPWINSFNIGIHEIDRQHKKLVRHFNKFASFAIQQPSSSESYTLINELLDYAAYHFEAEEQFWLNALPEGHWLDEHREHHKQFLWLVNELKKDVENTLEKEWLEELLPLFAHHILEGDKYMALLVEATQAGKALDEAAIWADKEMCEKYRESVEVLLSLYKTLSDNTIRLMREIKTGNQTLNKLTENKRFLHEAMNYAQIGRWSQCYHKNIADWSPQIFTMFGLPQEATPGIESLFSIMHEEFKLPFVNSIQRSFDTGEEHFIEYQVTRPSDGELRWFESRGKVVYRADGTPHLISGFIQDITTRKANEDKIKRYAYYDLLTSLPNRRLLLERLNKLLALSKYSNSYNALLFIDIDNFKTINDSHGHDYGDVFLKQVACRVQQSLRQGDTLARVGGDEFVVILSDLSEDQRESVTKTQLIADTILHSIAMPYTINNHQFNSSGSIGMVLFNDTSIPCSNLMKFADIAMYQAKHLGKNSTCFYEAWMQKKISERVKLERRLRKAIDKQQFKLYYQPQVDNYKNVVGAEALIRWMHPVDGLISPDEFIPLAEDSGLIIPIGDWVLETACQQLKRWKSDRKTRNLTLAINVSYKQFCQPDFVSKVIQLVNKYGVSKGKLKIELTETMLVDDIELTISHMETLKELGIKISLDDFGTGYSSLQHLKQLPLSQLKIDRSFVTELESNSNDQSIVKTIIVMANALDIDVIAEGVETAEQQAYLYEHRCMSYQGYLYSKPVPLDEFERYLVETEMDAINA